MSIRKLFLASAGALILQSCVTQPPVLTASDLLSEPYVLSSGRAFDVDAFFSALPDWLSVSYAGASFDSGIGAMVVDDLAFSLRAAPDYRIRAGRATIWDADVEAMAQVLRGVGDLSVMTPLFDRIAFENISSEGMQWDTGAQSLGLSIDKLVLDGLSARSFALADKASAPEGAAIFRMFAALATSYAYDGGAYSNFSFQMNDNQGNVASLTVNEAFARGYDAGRVEYNSAYGVRTKTFTGSGDLVTEVSQMIGMDGEANPVSKILQPDVRMQMRTALKNPVAAIAAASGAGSNEREIAFLEMRDIDLQGAMSWLARWELPPITETDLIDLGSSTIIGEKQFMNGAVIYERARADVTAADFYWLVPSRIDYVETGAVLNVKSLLDMMTKDMPEADQYTAQAYEAVSALGLEQISFDGSFNWLWNGETGDASLQSAADIVDFARFEYGAAVGGPTLARWDEAFRSDDFDSGRYEMSLGALNFSVTDYQMIDRVLSYVAAQSGETPEDLRLAAPALIRLSGAEAAAMNPRIPAYLDAFAGFIETGGALSINMNPVEPVSFQELQMLNNSPQTLPDVLNLTVTHTP
ncbi:MAG: hypothetical protein AAF936_17785 [Pseudomonadota bacterium]